jgi:hypothetical protein
MFKESKFYLNNITCILADTGYQGISKLNSNSIIPIKKKRNILLTEEQKEFNHKLSSKRIGIENVFSILKRFKIISCKYRNRRKRFGLRFNLIAGFYNWELGL